MDFRNDEARKSDFIRELLKTGSMSESAARVGLGSRTTVYNTMRADSDFRRSVESARQQFNWQLLDSARRAAPSAVDSLIDIYMDKNAPASARVSAASKIVDLASVLDDKIGQSLELDSLVSEVRALEHAEIISDD